MSNYNAYAATTAKGPLEPFSYDPGALGPEEVEIKVTHCGICHSDLSMLDNDWGMSNFPFVPGHEVVGTITALGDQAKGLKIGQKVGLGWSSHSCLSCHECLSGDHHLCSTVQGTILGRHGGFADRVRASGHGCGHFPKASTWRKPARCFAVGQCWEFVHGVLSGVSH